MCIRDRAQAAQLSTYSWNLLPTSPMVPAGLDNYRRLTELPEVGQSVWRTVILILGLLPFSLILPVVVGFATREVLGRARVIYSERDLRAVPDRPRRGGRRLAMAPRSRFGHCQQGLGHRPQLDPRDRVR